jgi:hypothetical protein
LKPVLEIPHTPPWRAGFAGSDPVNIFWYLNYHSFDLAFWALREFSLENGFTGIDWNFEIDLLPDTPSAETRWASRIAHDRLF